MNARRDGELDEDYIRRMTCGVFVDEDGLKYTVTMTWDADGIAHWLTSYQVVGPIRYKPRRIKPVPVRELVDVCLIHDEPEPAGGCQVGEESGLTDRE